MIPIYEQGDGRGIGYGLKSFMARFDEICRTHLRERRAKCFAFIFYDFTNHAIRAILKDQGVFAKIDRLAGDQLSVFYLHAGTMDGIAEFNSAFLSKLGATEPVELPCVVFFKLGKEGIDSISIAQLDSTDLIHGFDELQQAVKEFVRVGTTQDGRGLRWLRRAGGIVSAEVFRAALRVGLDRLL